LRIGLSGGLGAGKSTVGRLLAARGAVVIDTDQVAREVLAPGGAGERAVLEHFGPSVALANGSLDRRALADLVFAVPSERLALEAITHPLIRRGVEERIASLEAGADAGATPAHAGATPAHAGATPAHAGATPAAARTRAVVVIEIPLLDAARRRDYSLDTVVLVEAPEAVAVLRAQRRGISREQAIARMAAQPTPADRRAAADRVITNTGSLRELEAQVNDLWADLVQDAPAE
jgi:dephospho-CoA kinase